jgi:hypothetical protein
MEPIMKFEEFERIYFEGWLGKLIVAAFVFICFLILASAFF